MAKVLVTGGSGFVGTNLVEHYSRLGGHVINVDIAAPRNTAHAKFWTQLDIRDGRHYVRSSTTFLQTLFFIWQPGQI